eukprot:scaffold22088_cov114-Isochrysis_galbana.AAC.2
MRRTGSSVASTSDGLAPRADSRSALASALRTALLALSTPSASMNCLSSSSSRSPSPSESSSAVSSAFHSSDVEMEKMFLVACAAAGMGSAGRAAHRIGDLGNVDEQLVSDPIWLVLRFDALQNSASQAIDACDRVLRPVACIAHRLAGTVARQPLGRVHAANPRLILELGRDVGRGHDDHRPADVIQEGIDPIDHVPGQQ